MSVSTCHHWRSYLALEADFVSTLRYVEFATDNFGTYSLEFAKLLLTFGSLADVVARQVCKALGTEANTIGEYRECISNQAPVYNDMVHHRESGITLQPWEEWHKVVDPKNKSKEDNPSWWAAYNDVKHRGLRQKATLENCARALAGLFTLTIYCRGAEQNYAVALEPESRFFVYCRWGVAPFEPSGNWNPWYSVFDFNPSFKKTDCPLSRELKKA